MEYNKKIKIFDLGIILLIAILPAIIKSAYYFMYGVAKYSPAQLNFSIISGIVEHCLSLLLLFYILFNRQKTYKDLGITINLKDIGAGFLLAIITLVITGSARYFLIHILPVSYSNLFIPKNLSFIPQNFSLLFLIYLIVNPFFEELIVRGFTMTEIFSLTNSKVLAVILSTVIQISYHLYQGIVPALILGITFLMYSIFFIKTGKLTPVIVAHLITDLLILTRIK